ncbi:MAG: archaellin/type IV pilin N-terminal domain-containing protein [Candidatus Nanohaloarchaea archaeon]|nr:archaellin/type IV pilin N-terminal domain-containing protein [Candidatus Nanohaloarchaea archaeon]
MRKGITPVVAMVLLLMMTVAAAGAAYVWTQGIISGQRQEATQQLNTEITVRDLQCAAGSGEADFFLDNTGSTTIAASDVTAYLYNVSDNSLITTVDTSHSDLAPGANWDGTVSFGGSNMASGFEYSVQWEFANQGSYSVSATCQAE